MCSKYNSPLPLLLVTSLNRRNMQVCKRQLVSHTWQLVGRKNQHLSSYTQVSHRSLGGSIDSSVRSRAAVRPFTAARCSMVVRAEVDAPRLRLNNLGPEPGSRRQELRKGRGYGAGQVRIRGDWIINSIRCFNSPECLQGGTCGFGNRGQKCRSGSGTRPGFEGGQTPMYRRLPKLRGIAGGEKFDHATEMHEV